MIRIIALIIGYCCGNISTGYLIGKSKGIDIRTLGSGNAGATNALRVLGPKLGAVTFLGDFLKAAVPCLIAKFIDAGFDNDLLVLWTGLGVILGHDFPLFMGFRGGKGVASTYAMLLVLDFKLALIAVAVWVILFLITGMVSLCSIISLAVGGILIALDMNSVEATVLVLVFPVLSIFLHRANIKRIIKGEEKKIILKNRS